MPPGQNIVKCFCPRLIADDYDDEDEVGKEEKGTGEEEAAQKPKQKKQQAICQGEERPTTETDGRADDG
ncbi:hypothetical protein niasHT_034676 [Heterodera trifolii]|uniref:Uncharacterized protein n=1 Tax=Heterodera trifolii TaxID=157864 RepID=A0ABD2IKY8_9BILA